MIPDDRQIVQIRNHDFVPQLDREGFFLKSLPTPNTNRGLNVLSPHRRLFYHQTLNSARKSACYQQYDQGIPSDSLDFILNSVYNDKAKLHADKMDIIMQRETIGQRTFRQLRNTIDVIPEYISPIGHPLVIGGITTKISPHSVKLAHNGHHTPLTNKGYSRQPLDGNIFNY